MRRLKKRKTVNNKIRSLMHTLSQTTYSTLKVVELPEDVARELENQIQKMQVLVLSVLNQGLEQQKTQNDTWEAVRVMEASDYNSEHTIE
jgi:predicted FMN-binding regulatory protein PaiB